MISIITPVYNGESCIRLTLDALSQQKPDFEHLVMDACSTDQTCKIAESYAHRYNVRVISERDKGLYDAIQNGFAKTSGDILGWINAGDIYMPWTLSVVEKVFALYPKIEWITGVTSWYYEETNLFRVDITVPVYSQYCIRKGWNNGRWFPAIQHESTFWRRSLWEKSRGADILRGQGRGGGYASDYHLWKRFAEYAPLRTVCTVLASFTISPGQITDRFRTEYAKECGLDRYYECPNSLTRSLFRLNSFCKLGLKSRAVTGNKLSEEFPIRVI